MDKYKQIRDNLIFTHHGRENLYGLRKDGSDRTDIPIHRIVLAIMYGTRGFAGSNRFKVSYNGITVLFKIDEQGHYVIITYYKSRKKKVKSLYKAFDEIKKEKV